MDDAQDLLVNWRSVAIAGLLVCALLTQLFCLSKGIERRASFWLLLFFLAVAIDSIPMIIGFAGAYDIWPGLTFLPVGMALFFGPLVYFHARHLMEGVASLEQYALLVPGFLYWLYQLWAFTMLGDYRAKWAYNNAFHEPVIIPFYAVLTVTLTAWCFLKIWQMRQRYIDWLNANRSDGDAFDPRWITHLMALGIFAALLWAVEFALYLTLEISYFEQFWWDIAMLFCVLLISLEALTRITQPFPKMLAPDAVSVEELLDATAAERDWVTEGERLQAMVLENGWHLESTLSLQTLARRFGMNQAYVSRALNKGLDLSFSSFVNGLRVEYAKSMIMREDVNLLDVALSSGFGSKASFNRAFQAHAGLSPSEYRRLNS
ncbi:helix-turn-helix domain-containing protein [Altererythrobacter lutimaris]|uniref:Helix-turn-helix transcriptional regulator n=1 Tax=Altererythrobacter lutimaris TaxID=2743979 RepID=A0A850HAW3_9SPHN|nr:AraC family transcriptional regulator [Altererythrobacter lutimaris]NVE93638.1 helix-turn-helix transcriptional regulator [Altererythrobacter lutimaris]